MSAAVLVTIGVLAVAPAWAEKPLPTEKPPTFRASDLLPKELLKGSNYQIKEPVQNDGFFNLYDLETDYGPLQVRSTAKLMVRLQELAALQKMQQVEQTDSFKEAFAKAAKTSGQNTVNLAHGLFTNPRQTVSGMVSGAGSYLNNLGQSLTGGLQSGGEGDESTWKKMIGYDKAKRQVAYEFGVDPYSDYGPLQDRLAKLSWAAYAGGKSFTVGLSLVPGGAGIAISSSRLAGDLHATLCNKSAAELASANEKSLQKMGADPTVISAFLNHPKYSPSQKTLIVAALDRMNGVENRQLFLEQAALAEDDFMAFYFQLQAALFATYHQKTEQLDAFVLLGNLPFGRTKSEMVVGLFPFDYLAWTDNVAGKARAETAEAAKRLPGAKGQKLVVAGTVGKLAQRALSANGWKVEGGFGGKLGTDY